MPHFLQKIIAIFIIIFLFPLYIIATLLIFFDDGFPVIFKQKRLSQGDSFFNMYKFRTMKKNAEEILKKDSQLYAIFIENNHKIPEELETRFLKSGPFLRKTSIDELPQLFNVIFGDINLVGNRPIEKSEWEMYSNEEKKILSKERQGLTGLWQVSGRSLLRDRKRIQIEIQYIKEKSFMLDLKIIIKTIKVVLMRIGSF